MLADTFSTALDEHRALFDRLSTLRPAVARIGSTLAGVLRAAEAARVLGIATIGLLGRDGGPLLDRCDDALVVPSQVTARIQEAHIFVGHCWCSQIELELGLA